MTLRILQAVIGLIFLVSLAGCEGQGDVAENDGNSDGEDSDGDEDDDGFDTDFDTDDGDQDTETESDTEDICFEEDADLDVVPTRVMLVIDSSSSMLDAVNGAPKWEQARDAMIAAVEPWVGSKSIEFGLDFFPDIDSGDCAVDDPAFIDTTEDASEQIVVYLKEDFIVDEDGSTPLCHTMHKFNTDPDYAPEFTNPDFDRYIIVVSDGEDTCWFTQMPFQPPCDSAFDWPQQVAGALLDTGIKTYAIGFGFSGDAQVLDNIMKWGGTGLTEHIPVDDGAALQAELEKISETVVSCTFDFIPDVEVNYDEINVYADGDVVPFDEDCHNGAGWDWGNDEMTQIVLCPIACDKLKKGEWKIITATAGCPVIVIE